MADEKVITLLEEIRDLQKLRMENQQLAIEMQRKTSRWQRIGLVVLIVIVFAGMATAVLPSLFGR